MELNNKFFISDIDTAAIEPTSIFYSFFLKHEKSLFYFKFVK
jgi:hypothetical protein